LVAHYKAEDLLNRKVVVVCNLKPRNLVGFKSNGMVLCAAKVGGNNIECVELLEPPDDARVGDRIYGENLDGEPLAVNKCDKLKAFEQVAQDLKVLIADMRS
jgi:tRNA-binding EMAP/Myf-like protein